MNPIASANEKALSTGINSSEDQNFKPSEKRTCTSETKSPTSEGGSGTDTAPSFSDDEIITVKSHNDTLVSILREDFKPLGKRNATSETKSPTSEGASSTDTAPSFSDEEISTVKSHNYTYVSVLRKSFKRLNKKPFTSKTKSPTSKGGSSPSSSDDEHEKLRKKHSSMFKNDQTRNDPVPSENPVKSKRKSVQVSPRSVKIPKYDEESEHLQDNPDNPKDFSDLTIPLPLFYAYGHTSIDDPVPSTSRNTVPWTSDDPVPSTSRDSVPWTSDDPVPSTSMNTVPSTSDDPVPSTSMNTVPSTSDDPVPSTSMNTVPSTSDDPVPSTSMNTVPLTSASTNIYPPPSSYYVPLIKSSKPVASLYESLDDFKRNVDSDEEYGYFFYHPNNVESCEVSPDEEALSFEMDKSERVFDEEMIRDKASFTVGESRYFLRDYDDHIDYFLLQKEALHNQVKLYSRIFPKLNTCTRSPMRAHEKVFQNVLDRWSSIYSKLLCRMQAVGEMLKRLESRLNAMALGHLGLNEAIEIYDAIDDLVESFNYLSALLKTIIQRCSVLRTIKIKIQRECQQNSICCL